MMHAFPRPWMAFAAVAAIQTAVLGWMVWDRVSLLKHGREIVVEVTPVDPRDMFRGDYVIFNYPFSRTGEVTVPATSRQGDAIYVTLAPKGNDAWEMTKVDAAYPAATPSDGIVIKGIVSHVWRDPLTPATATANLRYGIESYFVPEGTGRTLEDLVRDKKISAVIAVGRDGDAAIKALVVDGQRIVEEPLL